MSETFKQKILRHVRERQFDPATLLRGANQLTENMMTGGDIGADLYLKLRTDDFLGIPGFISSSYLLDLNYGKYDIRALRPARTLYGISVNILDFPIGSRFGIHVTESSVASRLHTSAYANVNKEVIATYTGPTFHIEDRLPNNGFYFEGDLKMPFGDTNPPGQRRGAFTFTESGGLAVIDDEVKWALVDQNFPRMKAVVGTASYYRSTDTGEEPSYMQELGRSRVSCLMQYWDSQSQVRVAFAYTHGVARRITLKRGLDKYLSDVEGQSYIAAELELTGASAVVKGPAETKYVGGGGFEGRQDHYYVLPPVQQGESHTDETNNALLEIMSARINSSS